MVPTAEKLWQQLFIEKLQRVEGLIAEIQMKQAVQGVQGMTQAVRQDKADVRQDKADVRAESMPNRSDITALDKRIVDILTDIDTRVMTLEKQRENLMGRLVVIGTLGMVVFSVIVGLIVKFLKIG